MTPDDKANVSRAVTRDRNKRKAEALGVSLREYHRMRNEEIVAAWRAGQSYAGIGRRFDIGRVRVWQIIMKHMRITGERAK